ncbi:MAG: translation initiation factor IF-6 [Candidatus Bathyarchaeia archaeon]
MAISLLGLFGNPSIGIYSLVTDRMILVPSQISASKVKKLEVGLKVKALRVTLGESVLLGVLACANSKGIILPHFVREEEVQAIKSAFDINVTVMETKRTAYGNLVLANDKGAVTDPRLKGKDLKTIADTLGVEAVPGEIAGLPYVGSLAVATNKGVLAHPLLREEERKVLADVLKVPVDVGTVNGGVPYVATGLRGNSYGAVAGYITTGPELFIIGQVLDVAEKNE